MRSRIADLARVLESAQALAPVVEHVREEDGSPSYIFRVPSSSSDSVYTVDARGVPLPRLDNLRKRALCDCQAGTFGTRGCSHVTAVWLRWRQEQEAQPVSEADVYEEQRKANREPESMPVESIVAELRRSEPEPGRQAALLSEYGQRMRLAAALREERDSVIEKRLRYTGLPYREQEALAKEYKHREQERSRRAAVEQGRDPEAQPVRLPWAEEI